MTAVTAAAVIAALLPGAAAAASGGAATSAPGAGSPSRWAAAPPAPVQAELARARAHLDSESPSDRVRSLAQALREQHRAAVLRAGGRLIGAAQGTGSADSTGASTQSVAGVPSDGSEDMFSVGDLDGTKGDELLVSRATYDVDSFSVVRGSTGRVLWSHTQPGMFGLFPLPATRHAPASIVVVSAREAFGSADPVGAVFELTATLTATQLSRTGKTLWTRSWTGSGTETPGASTYTDLPLLAGLDRFLAGRALGLGVGRVSASDAYDPVTYDVDLYTGTAAVDVVALGSTGGAVSTLGSTRSPVGVPDVEPVGTLVGSAPACLSTAAPLAPGSTLLEVRCGGTQPVISQPVQVDTAVVEPAGDADGDGTRDLLASTGWAFGTSGRVAGALPSDALSRVLDGANGAEIGTSGDYLWPVLGSIDGGRSADFLRLHPGEADGVRGVDLVAVRLDGSPIYHHLYGVPSADDGSDVYPRVYRDADADGTLDVDIQLLGGGDPDRAEQPTSGIVRTRSGRFIAGAGWFYRRAPGAVADRVSTTISGRRVTVERFSVLTGKRLARLRFTAPVASKRVEGLGLAEVTGDGRLDVLVRGRDGKGRFTAVVDGRSSRARWGHHSSGPGVVVVGVVTGSAG